MSPKPKRRKCRCCSEFFFPDPRNLDRQHYCGKSACRHASKLASQRRWLRKPANRDYFRDRRTSDESSSGARPIRAIGRRHPYGNANPCYHKLTRFSHLVTHRPGLRCVTRFRLAENPAFVGLFTMITGSTLQEDIAATARRVIEQGRNILGLNLPGKTPGLFMICKHLLRADRQRQIPPSFSWVDHRLIRHQHLAGCGHDAWALYLFLVTVADVQGLSYYSDASIGRHLKIDLVRLAAARQQLVRADLIAYRKPLYQVLSLPDAADAAARRPPSGQTQSVGDILRRALAGGSP